MKKSLPLHSQNEKRRYRSGGPDFVNAYPKNHQRIEVRYVDAVS